MRILSITAGAGGMYCGSCLRDNALAAELLTEGHDVTLLPLYTPIRTDETDVSEKRVFFGGISVYLQQHVSLFRHTPWLLDRLWDSPAVIKAVAGGSVSTDPHMLGGLTVSVLKGEEGFQSKEILKLLRYLEAQPAFDLVSLPNSLLLGLAPALARGLGRPICCTLQGEDVFLDGLEPRYKEEALALIRRHAPAVDGFVAVSDYYADFMAGYLGIPRAKIHTVPLGINLEGHQPRGSSASRPFTIGYLARVAPEKGLHLLCEAYRILRREMALPEGQLEVAGYLGSDHRDYLKGIEGRMGEWGLGAEFHYHGALDRADKIRFLQGLDVLSVPSPYHEPKGLYALEALANGVPVVQPRHGAFPEIIAKTGGGVLVEPNDARAFAEGIHSLFRDRSSAEELGRQGAQGVRSWYAVPRMAERTLEVHRQVIESAAPADGRRREPGWERPQGGPGAPVSEVAGGIDGSGQAGGAVSEEP
jgi:glycosyltransferase involved in cell wall biosynthesis